MAKAGQMKACLHCDKRLASPFAPVYGVHRDRKAEGWCQEVLRVCNILLKELKSGS